MREQLKKINGLRKEFIGRFVRFGQKTNFKGYPEPTILIENVKCTGDENICCDHLWFNLTKQFESIKLQEGDIIRFNARCKEYVKGYKGHRYDDEEYLNEHPIENDYKLSHPTKVMLLKRIKGEDITQEEVEKLNGTQKVLNGENYEIRNNIF